MFRNSPPHLFLLRRTRRGSEHGASLVEYAFTVILSLTLLFGISGFGHALYVYHALNNAAKDGSRWAAVNGKTCGDDGSCNGTNGMNNGAASTSDIQTYVSNHLPASVDSTQATVTATFLAPGGSPPVCTKQVKDINTGNLIGPYSNYPGCTVQVQVAYAYNFIFPLLPSISTTTSPCTKAGLCLSSDSEMVIVH